ncbi:hypothetical protein B0T24DRAFT_529756 [Lasiosphaeria ovina]|uniref:UmuC domain-containing protein n=1 Tax=Lasiosphaeria ovina TaxID=92902 RepID=A0AAE0K9Z5_9PEZI|nr:hypothetical protein B0T24DRAFT_529756 [Lasiosphaeria ovina]
MDHRPKKKAPRRNDYRVVLHFDIDCFYAQACPNQQPALKAVPLGIKQKSILATCNYAARRRGVKKLMLIAEARKVCPELVIVEGEDLTPFRDVSKRLYALLRAYSWSGKTERLGLDEVFLDVTDVVAYNIELLNRNTLARSYFCLSRTDPEQGFEYDASAFAGCVVYGCGSEDAAQAAAAAVLDSNPLAIRLLVASHLANYIRLKIEQDGFTSSCGIATSKLLAKLVGDKNKPRNQTALAALHDDHVLSFMDGHRLRKVPGIGAKTTHILEAFVTSGEVPDLADVDLHTMECSLTVGEVRTHAEISAPTLQNLLGGRPGSEKGLGAKVWALLHGVDDTEVKPARDVPTQISIEDTYRGLNEVSEVTRELFLLSLSLLRRMLVDLVEDLPKPTWLAYPKTIRLTTRPKTSAAEGKPYNWSRSSRSAPMPDFVLNAPAVPADEIADRLVAETLLPLFYKLYPPQQQARGWNIGLLNVCATNMTGGADGKSGVANNKNIATMFRRQEDVLREFTEYSNDSGEGGGGALAGFSDDNTWDQDDDGSNYREDMEQCPLCGRFMPRFAQSAHDRFHSMEQEEADT